MRSFNNDGASTGARGSSRPGGRSGGRPSFGGGFGGSRPSFGGGFGGNRSGGSRFGSDSGSRRFGSRDSGRAEMHDATCADCGKTCQVPFMPTGAKPVYCSDCFEMRGNGEDRNNRPPRYDKPSYDKPSFGEKRSFSAPAAAPIHNDSKKFDLLHAKLDRILNLLEAMEINQDDAEDSIFEEVEVEVKPKAKKVKAPKAAMTIMPLAPAPQETADVEDEPASV